MRHQRTRDVYEYWQSLRNGCSAPRRIDIDPIAIGHLLPFVFILERRDPLGFLVRLAGTYVCDCFGRELRQSVFTDLWHAPDQSALDKTLLSVTNACCGAVVEFTGHAGGARRVSLEVILLPLLARSGDCSRVLGTLTALESADWIGSGEFRPPQVVSIEFVRHGSLGGSTAAWLPNEDRQAEAMAGDVRYEWSQDARGESYSHAALVGAPLSTRS